MIKVKKASEGDPMEFQVRVKEGGSETTHRVTMKRSTHEALTKGAHSPERCVEAAFEFLLDREPKESILGRFDITVISRYFPEFEGQLPGYLAGRK
jgi:hypothetical protein